MAGFVEVVTKFFRPYKRIILVIFILIIFIIVGVYGYRSFYSVPEKTRDFKDVANADRRNPQIQIYLFWADWCPHCKKAKPEWVAFSQEYNGKIVNNYEIQTTDIDCSDPNGQDPQVQNMLAEYRVNSYPTIIALKDSQVVGFDAKITKSSLDQFVESLTN
jgi:thiol-disulfide isomerase/thioredoxin